jgi:ribosome-binding protein aMBF1 (putative translation factor)
VRFCFSVAAVDTGLVEALATAAKRAREENDVSREEVAVKLGASVDKVRYFENARAFGALDELVDAYSATTGVSLFDLLDEAQAILKKKG